ncbi:MAG: heavy-metal-associated domain-containing protein [Bacteroidota bacterium]|nr:heavy-metal-associated domain-containing protein [Bacteroidota bacterium]
MTHEYKLSGLTCSGCVAKVKSELLKLTDVLSAEVTQDKATISMDKHIPLSMLQQTISTNGKYTISESETSHHAMAVQEEAKSWIQTYKPLLLIALFITGVSYIASHKANGLDGMLWMNYFMAGFFLVFSFFKFLDLKGFAESYSMYDVLAKKVKVYGYIYPFIELTLGILFLTGFQPLSTNIATIVIMGFSSIGVIQSVLNKKKIRCACLGAVFNLPMSTVTIIEDLLMAGMAITGILWSM